MIRMVISGQEIIEAELIDDASKVNDIINKAVMIFGEELQTQVKANASGRPGPEVITGEYRDSIQLEYQFDEGGIASAEVYSDAVFSADLEFGREGRFAHPAYPHFGPAAEEVEDLFLNYVLEELDKL